jgi:hypothetical protein
MTEQALLISPSADNWNRHRPVRSNEYKPIPHGYFYVLSLKLSRHSIRDIAELSGYAESTIYAILQDPRIIAVRQQILKRYDDELEELYPKVIAAIAAHLDADSLDARYKGSDMWLKIHGKYKGGDKVTVNLSAEDIAIQIIQQVRDGGQS